MKGEVLKPSSVSHVHPTSIPFLSVACQGGAEGGSVAALASCDPYSVSA